MNELDEPMSYECLECGESFFEPHALQVHIRMHAQQVFQCNDCGKQFKLEFSLKLHLMNDTGEFKYECGICGRKYRNENCLDNHYRVHNNEKPYRCRKCGKTFPQLGGFKAHVMEHPPSYCCGECGKEFSDPDSFDAHEKTHEAEKPYVCPKCEKRFAHAFNLEIHTKAHCPALREGSPPMEPRPFNVESPRFDSPRYESPRYESPRYDSPRYMHYNGKVWSNGESNLAGTKGVEVIDLSDDEDGYNDCLPLEVCLNEGEEEMNFTDDQSNDGFVPNIRLSENSCS